MTSPVRRLGVPAELAAAGITLRPRQPEDRAFLERLYVSVRRDELAATPWSDAEKRAFLADQFALQDRHYAAYYGDSEFAVVECRGEPIGRLYLHRGSHDFRVVDISLLPEHRGCGIGRALLQAVIDEAAAAGCMASINVEVFNPAQRLYWRLGFRPEGPQEGPYQFMTWRPRPSTSDSSLQPGYA